MYKFFIKPENILGDFVIITGKEDLDHFRVLRIKKGEHIIVSDGNGHDYESVFEDSNKSFIKLKIISDLPSTESNIDITIYQALPKSTKMDLIVQKCTELGVSTIIPVITKRVVVNSDNIAAKVKRWQRIAYESSKQSHRSRILKVCEPMYFKDLLDQIKGYEIFLLPYENEKESHLKDVIKGHSSGKIGILIGAEGGFAPEEIEMAQNSGARTVTLGPRILRTETTGIVVVSIIMYEMGDIG